MLTSAEVRFVLTSGGHNVGIVSEPGHPHRHFRIATRPQNGIAPSPDDWLSGAEMCEGSWWSAWSNWLGQLSGGAIPPPSLGNAERGYPPIEAAPGRYVLER